MRFGKELGNSFLSTSVYYCLSYSHHYDFVKRDWINLLLLLSLWKLLLLRHIDTTTSVVFVSIPLSAYGCINKFKVWLCACINTRILLISCNYIHGNDIFSTMINDSGWIFSLLFILVTFVFYHQSSTVKFITIAMISFCLDQTKEFNLLVCDSSPHKHHLLVFVPHPWWIYIKSKFSPSGTIIGFCHNYFYLFKASASIITLLFLYTKIWKHSRYYLIEDGKLILVNCTEDSDWIPV